MNFYTNIKFITDEEYVKGEVNMPDGSKITNATMQIVKKTKDGVELKIRGVQEVKKPIPLKEIILLINKINALVADGEQFELNKYSEPVDYKYFLKSFFGIIKNDIQELRLKL